MIYRKGASKHYFLSKVICFDRYCRSFTGFTAKQNKQRFKGFKNERDSYLYRERAPRQDSIIASNDPTNGYDRFELDRPTEFESATFKTNSARLEKRFLIELDDFGHYLLTHPNYQVKIIGHTDDVGSGDFNQQLSQDRAQAVVDYLIDQGIEQNRFTPIGRGNSQPLDIRATLEARKKNRRVEFELSNR